jgi:hypothetical protein
VRSRLTCTGFDFLPAERTIAALLRLTVDHLPPAATRNIYAQVVIIKPVCLAEDPVGCLSYLRARQTFFPFFDYVCGCFQHAEFMSTDRTQGRTTAAYLSSILPWDYVPVTAYHCCFQMACSVPGGSGAVRQCPRPLRPCLAWFLALRAALCGSCMVLRKRSRLVTTTPSLGSRNCL